METSNKGKITILICALLLTSSLSSCSGDDGYSRRRDRGERSVRQTENTGRSDATDDPTQQETYPSTANTEDIDIIGNIPLPEGNQVIFHSRYTNMAWGTQKSETFILSNGDIYSYSAHSIVPSEIQSDEDSEPVPIVDYLIAYSEPVLAVDTEDLTEIYNEAIRLGDGLSDYTEECQAYDAGNETSYFVDPATGEDIPYNVGAEDRAVTDNEDLQAFWDHWAEMDHTGRLAETPEIHFGGVINLQKDYIMGMETENYFIFDDPDTLISYAASEWNIDLSDDLSELYFTETEYMDVFVRIQILDNDIEPSCPVGLIIQGNEYRFMDPLDEGTPDVNVTEDEINPYEVTYSNISICSAIADPGLQSAVIR